MKSQNNPIHFELNFPDQIYGRTKEIELFHEILNSFKEKDYIVLQLLGEPGIGKSYFLNKLIHNVARYRVYYGRYERFQRGVPYLGIRKIVEQVMDNCRKKGESAFNKFQSDLRFHLADYYVEIVNVIPSLGEIWEAGAPKNDDTGSPKALQNRIHQALLMLIKFIVNRELKPTVICIDDLQWCDRASQSFIIHLAKQEISGLMLILSSRSATLSDTLPTKEFFQQIQHLNHLEQLSLNSLSRKTVGELLEIILADAKGDLVEMRDYVYEMSVGNPFRLNETLSDLLRSGKLFREADSKQWNWHFENDPFMVYEKPISGFLKDKLNELNQDQISILQQAACFGSNLNVPFIGKILGENEEVVRSVFQTAVSMGFLVKADIPGQEGLAITNNFEFVHEMAQESVRASLREDEKMKIHRRIGKYFCEGTFIGLADRDVYDAAYHLNEAVHPKWSSEDLQQFAEVNYRAMELSHATASFSLAMGYLEQLVKMNGHQNWKHHYYFSAKVHILGYQIAMLNENEALSTSLFQEGITHLKALDRSKLRLTKTMLHIQLGELQSAIQEGILALKELGISVPPKAGILHIGKELVVTKFMLRKLSLDDIYNLPKMSNKKIESAIEIIFWMFRAAYHLNPELNAVLALKQLQLMLKHGTNGEAYSSLMAYGVIIGAASNNCKLAYDYAYLGSRIADKYKLKSGQLEFGRAIYSAYKIPLRDTLKLYESAKALSYQSGDFLAAAEPSANESLTMLSVGISLAGVEVKIKENLEFCKNLYATDFINFQQVLLYHVRMLKGEKLSLYEQNELSTIIEKSEFKFLHAVQVVLKMQLEVLKGNWDRVIEIAQKGKKEVQFLTGLYIQTEYSFFLALAYAKNYDQLTLAQKRKATKFLKTVRNNLKRWNVCAPETHEHRKLIIDALWFQKNKEFKQAEDILLKAYAAANISTFTQNAALIQWLLFDLYAQSKAHEKAQKAYAKSLELFTIWGTKVLG